MIAGISHFRVLKTEEASDWALQASTLQVSISQPYWYPPLN